MKKLNLSFTLPATKFKWLLTLCAGMISIGTSFAPVARAIVITPSLGDFGLTNTLADGTVVIAPDSLSFVLTGGNTGSGLSGTTIFSGLASQSGTVQFQFSYASVDLAGFDSGGYILNNIQTQLADTDGTSGSTSFSVTAGQMYGWWVGTVDNEGEPGVMTVMFEAQTGGGTTPEPTGFVLAFLGLGFAAIAGRRRLYSLVRTDDGKRI